jgi:hypothetical protein
MCINYNYLYNYCTHVNLIIYDNENADVLLNVCKVIGLALNTGKTK